MNELGIEEVLLCIEPWYLNFMVAQIAIENRFASPCKSLFAYSLPRESRFELNLDSTPL